MKKTRLYTERLTDETRGK